MTNVLSSLPPGITGL